MIKTDLMTVLLTFWCKNCCLLSQKTKLNSMVLYFSRKTVRFYSFKWWCHSSIFMLHKENKCQHYMHMAIRM